MLGVGVLGLGGRLGGGLSLKEGWRVEWWIEGAGTGTGEGGGKESG